MKHGRQVIRFCKRGNIQYSILLGKLETESLQAFSYFPNNVKQAYFQNCN